MDQFLWIANSKDCFYMSMGLLTGVNIESINNIGKIKLMSLNNWCPNERQHHFCIWMEMHLGIN